MCRRLLEIEDMDVAEACLKCIHLLSKVHSTRSTIEVVQFPLYCFLNDGVSYQPKIVGMTICIEKVFVVYLDHGIFHRVAI